MMTMQSVAFRGAVERKAQKPKVVIVGNGLGGVAAGRELGRLLHRKPNLAEVTIVGPSDQFVFKPQLHEVMNGKLPTVPMKTLFPESGAVQFKQATVTNVSIDPANKVLETSAGQMPFDYLIVAVGGRTAYYNHEKNAKLYALPLEELGNVDKIKASIHAKLDAAAKAPAGSDAQKKALSFVVVGGGATGVEYAFELQHFLKKTIDRHYPSLANQKPTVTIIEAQADILNGFSDKEKAYVKQRLRDKGIEVLCNHFVDNLDANGLKLSDRTNKEAPVIKDLPTEKPLWATGVRANTLIENLPVEKMPGNQRVKVNGFLEVPNRPDIYVVGDASAAPDANNSGRFLPPIGQVAEQEGVFVAKDLVGKLKSGTVDPKRPGFTYHNKGTMFSTGPGDGCVTLFNRFFITGRVAAWMRQAAYYLKLTRP